MTTPTLPSARITYRGFLREYVDEHPTLKLEIYKVQMVENETVVRDEEEDEETKRKRVREEETKSSSPPTDDDFLETRSQKNFPGLEIKSVNDFLKPTPTQPVDYYEMIDSSSLVRDPEALFARYERDGYLLIRGALPTKEINELRRSLEEQCGKLWKVPIATAPEPVAKGKGRGGSDVTTPPDDTTIEERERAAQCPNGHPLKRHRIVVVVDAPAEANESEETGRMQEDSSPSTNDNGGGETNAPPESNVPVCDKCKTPQKPKALAWGCAKCDYDQCCKCTTGVEEEELNPAKRNTTLKNLWSRIKNTDVHHDTCIEVNEAEDATTWCFGMKQDEEKENKVWGEWVKSNYHLVERVLGLPGIDTVLDALCLGASYEFEELKKRRRVAIPKFTTFLDQLGAIAAERVNEFEGFGEPGRGGGVRLAHGDGHERAKSSKRNSTSNKKRSPPGPPPIQPSLTHYVLSDCSWMRVRGCGFTSLLYADYCETKQHVLGNYVLRELQKQKESEALEEVEDEDGNRRRRPLQPRAAVMQLWMPLSHWTWQGGAVALLPGSHLFTGFGDASTNRTYLPAKFSTQAKGMPWVVADNVKPGDILLIDVQTVTASSPAIKKGFFRFSLDQRLMLRAPVT